MNLREVKKSLDLLFAKPLRIGAKRSIVFWYDDEGAFAESIERLRFADAKIIKLDSNNMFATKIYIERTDQTSNLLVYSASKQPDIRENWLADTIRYSQIFSADEVSLILQSFGMENDLKSVVSKHRLFFRKHSKGTKKFENYSLAPYSESKVHIGVLSALCGLPAPNLDNVVRTLIVEMVKGANVVYDSITAFGNIDAFWALIKDYYGFVHEEHNLCKLAVSLLCSHLAQVINTALPKEWLPYVSENPNCFVFVDNFMKNNQLWDDYNAVAAYVSDKLGLAEVVMQWTIDEIVDCDTFNDFDKQLIERIRNNVTQKSWEFGYYRKIINSRRNNCFFKDYEAAYSVLYHACEYLELAIIHKDLKGNTTLALFEKYVSEYYKLDSAYRHFIAAYDEMSDAGDFCELFYIVENSYANWFLSDLTIKWNNLWDDEEKWYMNDVTPQQDFYSRFMRDFVDNGERVVAVISDGLRYEAAVELKAVLNREQRGEAKLNHMFGVIPSHTALGMASVLPRKHDMVFAIRENADYEISGISTEGTDNRGKILAMVKKESIAIKYEDVIELNRQQMSETFSGKKLIYIYHNAIDAVGDNAKSEDKVFEATNDAFAELSTLVRKLCNEISAINIIITADHGFLYRRTKLEERDKTPKENAAAIISSRRFIMTKEQLDLHGTQRFTMDYFTKNHSGMIAILPRAANCFKLQGAGDRYAHGGSSLQEVVIPVITFKNDKNLKVSKSAKKVNIEIASISRKITNVTTYLTFFQTEPVDEKHLPLHVTVYFEDENGIRISNENIIIADSISSEARYREYKEKFTLKCMNYDKGRKYFLVLVNEQASVPMELDRVPYIIDLLYEGGLQF